MKRKKVFIIFIIMICWWVIIYYVLHGSISTLLLGCCCVCSLAYTHYRFYRWFYLVGYFFLIILFGFLYSDLSLNNFYIPNFKYEKDCEEYKQRLLKELKSEIVSKFKEKYNGSVGGKDKWRLDIVNKFRLLNLEYDQGDMTLTMSFDLASASEKEVISFEIFKLNIKIGDVRRPIEKHWLKRYPIKNQEEIVKELTGLELGHNMFIFDIIPQFHSMPPQGQSYGISFSDTLNSELYYFAKASDGFPKHINNHHLRMLYFSVVTATTLGYGDIIPFTFYSPG